MVVDTFVLSFDWYMGLFEILYEPIPRCDYFNRS